MDSLTILSAGTLGSDYQGLASQKRRASRQAETGLTARQGETPPETLAGTPGPAVSAVARDLGQDYPPFSRRQARQALEGLLPQIARSHPWRLAEIPAVSERTLIPSAYV